MMNSRPTFSVLLVDDSPHDREAARRYLRGDPHHGYDIQEAGSSNEALEVLRRWSPDAMIVDNHLPDHDGVVLIQLARQQGYEGAIVMLTGASDEPLSARAGAERETRAELALVGGAQDFLVKDEVSSRSLRRALHTAITKRRLEVVASEANLRAQRALVEMEQLAQRMSALHRFTVALSRAVTEDEVLSVAIAQVVERMTAEGVFIALAQGERLTIARSGGLGPEMLARCEVLLAQPVNPVREVVTTGQAVWVESGAEFASRYAEATAALGGVRDASWASIPVQIGGELLAVVGMRFSPAQAFPSTQREFLQSVGLIVGEALVRARQHDRERLGRERAERLVEYEKMIVGIVSHDLRNPLNVIKMGSSVLMNDQTLAPSRPLVSRIVNSADRMHRLIADLLDFTRGRLGDGIPIAPTGLDAGALLQTQRGELAQAFHGRALQMDVTGDTRVRWDGERMAQVISNLTTNALKHGSEAAPVVVRFDGSDAETVRLSVHNQGTPIPADLLPHLFEPFRQGAQRRDGVGLGLYISQQIVQAHGGTLTVSSTAEGGTTFEAVMPRRAP